MGGSIAAFPKKRSVRWLEKSRGVKEWARLNHPTGGVGQREEFKSHRNPEGWFLFSPKERKSLYIEG
jgi:hypothetical protein